MFPQSSMKIVEHDDLSVDLVFDMKKLTLSEHKNLIDTGFMWFEWVGKELHKHFIPVHQRYHPVANIRNQILNIISEDKFEEALKACPYYYKVTFSVSPTIAKASYTVKIHDGEVEAFRDQRTYSATALTIQDTILDDLEENIYGLDPSAPELMSSKRSNFFLTTADKNFYKRTLRENLTSLGINIKTLATITKRTTGTLRVTMSDPDKDRLCLFWKLFDWADASVKNMAVQPWVD